MSADRTGYLKFIDGLDALGRFIQRACELVRADAACAASPPADTIPPPVVEPEPEPVPEPGPVPEPEPGPPSSGPSNGRRKRRPDRPPQVMAAEPLPSRPRRAVLTDDTRRAIVAARLRDPRPLLAEIAVEFGISTGTVSNVLAHWRAEGGSCTPKKTTLPGQQDLPFKDRVGP